MASFIILKTGSTFLDLESKKTGHVSTKMNDQNLSNRKFFENKISAKQNKASGPHFHQKKIFLARHCTPKPPTIFSCTFSMLPDTPKTKIHAYRRHLSAVNSSFHRGLEVLFSMKLRALEVAMEKYLHFEQKPWLVV